MIDKGVNKSRGKKAEGRLAPLLEATADVDFRSQFWKALEAAVKDSTWMKVQQVEKLPIYTKEDIAKFKAPLLMVNTIFELSPNAQVLTVITDAKLYMKNLKTPDYFGYYTYSSDRLAGVDVKDEAAIAQWSANKAMIYRERIAEAIEENIAMMKYDLLSNAPGDDYGKDKKDTVKFYNGPLSKVVTYTGRIIKSDDKRVLFREKGGNLFSVAKGLIE